jgi:hypothetical protein
VLMEVSAQPWSTNNKPTADNIATHRLFNMIAPPCWQ